MCCSLEKETLKTYRDMNSAIQHKRTSHPHTQLWVTQMKQLQRTG